MKKVLIITNLLNVSTRMIGLAKYLSYFGYETTILTMSKGESPLENLGFSEKISDKIRIIETPYRGDIFNFWRKVFRLLGFKKKSSILNQIKEKTAITSKKSFIDTVFDLYRAIFAYPDEEKRWKNPAVIVGSQLLKTEKFDVIISSSSPVTAHVVAYELKKEFNIPWIADLRDLWSQNCNYNYGTLRKLIDRKLEIKTLSSANAITTVSGVWANDLIKLHNKKNIYVITNGFDPESVNLPPTELTKSFTITYTGVLYRGKRDPLKLFSALKELTRENIINPNDIEVRFFGPKEEWIEKEIRENNLSNIVKQYGITDRMTSLQKQKESQILLLLNWEDSREKGVYTGKIFEYLAARRPILSVGGSGEDVIEKLIRETKAGFYSVTVNDIKRFLTEAYSEYKIIGKVIFDGDIKEINKYNLKEIAHKFVNLFNSITI